MAESYAPFIWLGLVLLALVVIVWKMFGRARLFRSQSSNDYRNSDQYSLGENPSLEETTEVHYMSGYLRGRAESEAASASFAHAFARAIRNLIIAVLIGAILTAGYLTLIGQLHLPVW